MQGTAKHSNPQDLSTIRFYTPSVPSRELIASAYPVVLWTLVFLLSAPLYSDLVRKLHDRELERETHSDIIFKVEIPIRSR